MNKALDEIVANRDSRIDKTFYPLHVQKLEEPNQPNPVIGNGVEVSPRAADSATGVGATDNVGNISKAQLFDAVNEARLAILNQWRKNNE